MEKEFKGRCAFCGMSGDRVVILISGPRGNICKICVDACNQIFEKGTLKAWLHLDVVEEKSDVMCHFCEKPGQQCKWIVSGKEANICNECVNLCNMIIERKLS